MKNKLKFSIAFMLLFGIMFFYCLNLVNAEVQTLGTFKQNDCITLKQICSNCTYNNITSIINPRGNQILNQVVMTKIGTEYNYSFCNTFEIGDYIVNGKGDLDGTTTIWTYNFEITPTGFTGTLGFYIIMLIFPWVLFIFALWKKELSIAIISTILFYLEALYIIPFGIDGIKNNVTFGIGLVYFGFAVYTSLKYAIEYYEVS